MYESSFKKVENVCERYALKLKEKETSQTTLIEALICCVLLAIAWVIFWHKSKVNGTIIMLYKL